MLLVVTGRQEADFFRASDGEIEKIIGFKVKKPLFDDREGLFKRRGHGKIFASGAVYENQKEKIFQDFRREFRKILQGILRDTLPDRIYIVAPAYLKNDILDLFPKRAAARVKKVIGANMYDKHPFEVLERFRVRT